jgi:hypothetical protein
MALRPTIENRQWPASKSETTPPDPPFSPTKVNFRLTPLPEPGTIWSMRQNLPSWTGKTCRPGKGLPGGHIPKKQLKTTD